VKMGAGLPTLQRIPSKVGISDARGRRDPSSSSIDLSGAQAPAAIDLLVHCYSGWAPREGLPLSRAAKPH